MPTTVYLDNQSTTPVLPAVIEKMIPFFNDSFGNASSAEHSFGWEALDAIEESRAIIASFIGAHKDEIVFTSGATESNNSVIKGLSPSSSNNIHVISTNAEHKCILESLKHTVNIDFTLVPVDKEGRVSVESIRDSILPNTQLVSVIFANNEIGSINPIEEIGNLCRERGILFHTDAAQALGKIEIDVKKLKIDFLSASAHKLHGPKGVGLLFVAKSVKSHIHPLFSGGGQERGLRSGTLNTPGIVGFGKAVELAKRGFEERFWKCMELRDYFYSKLVERFPNVSLNGPDLSDHEKLRETMATAMDASSILKRLPNNLSVTFHGLRALDIIRETRDIAVSTGSACSSSTLEPSHVLTAIGLSEADTFSTIRFGISSFNSIEELNYVLDRYGEVLNEMRV